VQANKRKMAVDSRKCTVDFSDIGIVLNSEGKNYFVATARNSKGEPVGVGGAPFATKMIHCEGTEVPVEMKDNGDGTYTGTFAPVEPGSYLIVVGLLNSVGRVIEDMVKGSPFNVWVGPKPVEIPKEPASVHHSHVSGTNFKQAFVKQRSCFTIIALDANQNRLDHGGDPFKTKIFAPKGSKLPTIPSSVQDQQDGTYIVSYTPMAAGEHRVEVTLNDAPLPDSPFEISAVNANPEDFVDVPKTQVEFTSSPADAKGQHSFIVIPKSTKGEKLQVSTQFKVKIVTPDREEVKSRMYDNGDSTYTVAFTPELDGPHLVHVDHFGELVKGSPFRVEWKRNGNTLEIVSVVPSPEKLKADSDRTIRDRSVSAPVRPVSAPPKPIPQVTTASNSHGSPSQSHTPKLISSGSFLPKTTQPSAAKIPPKNPPKNPPPGSASKWKKSDP